MGSDTWALFLRPFVASAASPRIFPCPLLIPLLKNKKATKIEKNKNFRKIQEKKNPTQIIIWRKMLSLARRFPRRLVPVAPRSGVFLSTAANGEGAGAGSPSPPKSPAAWKSEFRGRLETEREKALLGGGESRIEKQHQKGKLTARERIMLLFDAGSFREYDQLKGHRCSEVGVVARHKNWPNIFGRRPFTSTLFAGLPAQ